MFKANGKAAKKVAAREKEAQEERLRREAAQQEEKAALEAAARSEYEQARFAIIENLSNSIGKVVSAAAVGDFSHRVSSDFPDAALVALANDVNTLIDSVDDGLTAAGQALGRVAKGDLSQGMDGDFKGAFKTL